MSNIQAPYIPNTPFTYGTNQDEEAIREEIRILFGEDNDDETVSREKD